MKVALICPDGLSVALFCKGIIRALLGADHASVVVLCDDGDYRSEIEALGAKCVRIEMSRYATPAGDLRYLFSLYRALRRHQVDVVVNFSTKPNIYGSLAARFAGARRVVSHVVGLGAAFLPAADVKSLMLREFVLMMYRVACGLSDAVWFTNENDVAYFLKRLVVSSRKVVVTRNYLDTDLYAPETVDPDAVAALKRELGLGQADKVVVMVARLIWQKGIREFAEAAEILRARRPDVKCVLLAPPEQGTRNAVPESYVLEQAAKPNFRYLKFLRDTRPLYALADLAVLPSYYREGGYPRALLEPMSMGKAIITTDCADTRGPVEVGRNGLLVPPRNGPAMAHAIADLLDDPHRLAEFGRYSREKARRDFDERLLVRQALIDCGALGASIPELIGRERCDVEITVAHGASADAAPGKQTDSLRA